MSWLKRDPIVPETPEELAARQARLDISNKDVGAVSTSTASRPSELRVKKYSSSREAERDARKMFAGGWAMEDQSTRTKKWSLATGFFTNKGITTITWVR